MFICLSLSIYFLTIPDFNIFIERKGEGGNLLLYYYCYKDLAYMIIEADKSQDLQLVNWRHNKAVVVSV